MKLTPNLRLIIAVLYLLIYIQCKSPVQEQHPNILFLLVDDLGWTDLSCYGSAFYETPNIDALADQGIRFTNAYASCPVCSPTRASVLTGQYPARLNITDWIPGLDPQDKLLKGTQDKHELPLEEQTMAEVFKSAGYATAFFGKWHLGDTGFFPEQQGFDLNIGGHWAGQPASYFYPYKNDRKRWDVPGLENGEDGEYLTDRLTTEAIKFMKEKQKDPFFIYLAYYNVHTPIQAKPDHIEYFNHKLARTTMLRQADQSEKFGSETKMMQDNPTYAGMVKSVDESVGRLMKELETLGLDNNTIIVFTSDNGGLSTLPADWNSPTSVAPLRAGKGWLYEGGIRVPAIIKTSDIHNSSRTCDIPIISMDYFPTLLDLTNIENPLDLPDAQSLVPILQGKKQFDREILYWHYPHYHGSLNRPSAAIRSGHYKLIEWMEDGSTELYNLEQDISEKHNLVELEPERAANLKEQLNQWQQAIGALYPVSNPNYTEQQR